MSTPSVDQALVMSQSVMPAGAPGSFTGQGWSHSVGAAPQNLCPGVPR